MWRVGADANITWDTHMNEDFPNRLPESSIALLFQFDKDTAAKKLRINKALI